MLGLEEQLENNELLLPVPLLVDVDIDVPIPTPTVATPITNTKPDIDPSSNKKGSLSRSELANQAWEQYVNRNNSVISDIFAGQLQSTVTCTECNHESYSFDPFLDLSVPIPRQTQQAQASFSDSNSNNTNNTNTNPSLVSRITPWRVRGTGSGSGNNSGSGGSNTNSPNNPTSNNTTTNQDVAVTKCTLEDCLEEFTGMFIYMSYVCSCSANIWQSLLIILCIFSIYVYLYLYISIYLYSY
mgnify:CR=1 FL=1